MAGHSASVTAYDASERADKVDSFRWKGPSLNVGQAGAGDMPQWSMAACMKGAIMAAAKGPALIPDDADNDFDGAGTMAEG